MQTPMELEQIVEALIFASPDGVSAREIERVVTTAGVAAKARLTEEASVMNQQAMEQAVEGDAIVEVGIADVPSDPLTNLLVKYAEVTEEEITQVILGLIDKYEKFGRAFTLAERPTGWRITAKAEYAPWVRQLFPEKKAAKLSPGALETLAIVAYRQPVTKSSLEAVRGVSVDGPIQTLLDRNIIRIAGRADLPGRPLLYETTDLFLEHFGVKSVDDLPHAAELRSVQLPDPNIGAEFAEPSAEQQELDLEGKKAKRERKKKEPKPPVEGETEVETVRREPAPAAAAREGAAETEAEPEAPAGRTLFVYEAPEEDEDAAGEEEEEDEDEDNTDA